MTTDYTSMWKSLGLDLEAHDALLSVLGQGYQDVFLSQKNRPDGAGVGSGVGRVDGTRSIRQDDLLAASVLAGGAKVPFARNW